MANLIVVCGPQAVGKMVVAGGCFYFAELSADLVIEAFGLTPDDKEEREYRFGA